MSLDSTAPSITTVVSQEGVQKSYVVGDEYNEGKATLTIMSDEEVSSIGPIYIETGTGDNLLPPITQSELTTTDNETFIYQFDVGVWDDNSPQVRIVSATDMYGNDNTGITTPFAVDTRAPVILENGITSVNFLSPETAGLVMPYSAGLTPVQQPQAGTGDLYWVDNDGDMSIYGRVEDNWTGGPRSAITADGSLKFYENDAVDDVVFVDIMWDDQSASTFITPLDNFHADITLPEGVTSSLTVKATDWTGNSVQQTLNENILVDEHGAYPYYRSITTKTGTKTWPATANYSTNLKTNDNKPSVEIQFKDVLSGSWPSGLGVSDGHWGVYLDNDENIANGYLSLGYEGPEYDGIIEDPLVLGDVFGSGIENTNPYSWSLSEGWTFQGTIDNDNVGLRDGTYHLVALVDDNVSHASPDPIDVVYSDFIADFTVDTVPPSLSKADFDGVGAGKGRANPASLLNQSEITIDGAAEPNATIKVLVNGSVAATTTADSTGEWTATITLEEGLNDIDVQAIDAAGNVTEKQFGFVNLTIDETEPSITITEPAAGTTTDELSVTVEATVEDTVTAAEDLGVAVRAPAYSVPEQSVSVDSDGNLTIDVPLQEGTNTISVIAEDEAGNRNIKNVTVERTVPGAANWAMYATFAAIIAIILAAIAIIRRGS